MPWRMRAKNLYLTWPQCDVGRTIVIDEIKQFFGDNLVWAVVCDELHKDGTPHIHAVLKLKKAFSTRSETALDVLAGQHGNYQTARSLFDTLTYITKDDTYDEFHIDAKEWLKLAKAKKSTKSAIIANMIIEDNTPIPLIMVDYPGFCMMHLKKLMEFEKFVAVTNNHIDLLEWGGVSELEYWPANAQTVARWVNKNICKDRKFKQKQLYLWGQTNMGKTHFINELEKYLRIYYLPTEPFYDDYRDGAYDLIVIDEFKGQCTLTFLNKLLEGSTMPIRKKGHQSVKTDNLPVIILSNYNIDGVYQNLDHVAHNALAGRLEIVELSIQMDLQYYDKELFLRYQKYNLLTDEVLIDEMIIANINKHHAADEALFIAENQPSILEVSEDSMDCTAPDAGTQPTQPIVIDLTRADNIINIHPSEVLGMSPTAMDIDAIMKQTGMWAAPEGMSITDYFCKDESSSQNSMFTRSPGYKDF